MHMKSEEINQFQNKIWLVSLILAPLLLAISIFFWSNGVLTGTAGWIQVLAFTFWILAFQGMFSLLKDKMPRYATIGFLIAIYACIGGNNFGMDGIYGEAIGINDIDAKNVLHEKLGIGGVISLYLPGILFPLSLIVLGINFIRAKTFEWWIGALLIIAAIGFPISRIPREPLLAHLVDVILILSHTLIGLKILKAQSVAKSILTR